jgi:DNA-binding IclR family transcriptional regulator
MSERSVKSALRVVEVLELFRKQRRPLSATEIGDFLGYPKSSTSMLLHTLVEAGWISLSTDSMLYFPTLRVAALGDWLPSQLFGGEVAEELVAELWERTQETATLSIPNGVHMEFVRVHVGSYPISLNLPSGTQVPMFGTAVGTAYLHTISEDAIARLYEAAVAKEAIQDARQTLQGYLQEIRRSRKLGYAVGYDRLLSDTGAIGVAIKGSGAEHAVVMGVGGLSSRIARNEDAIARLMKQLATRGEASFRAAQR